MKKYKLAVNILKWIAFAAGLACTLSCIVSWIMFGSSTTGYTYRSEEVSVVWADADSGLYAVKANDRLYSCASDLPLEVGYTVTMTCFKNGTASMVPEAEVTAARESVDTVADVFAFICFAVLVLQFIIAACASSKRASRKAKTV